MKRQGLSGERKPARLSSGKAGAGRIELCSGLLEGGTTPSMGLLQIVKQSVQIPVFVMIRPRGGDFLYSDREVEVMKADIQLAKLYGADGLVFGALTEDGQIDKELCMCLIALCRPLPVTFHRAFDMVRDPMEALQTLLTLGFERVLTSGCDSSALEGLPLIKRLTDEKFLCCYGSLTFQLRIFCKGNRCDQSKDFECYCTEQPGVAGFLSDTWRSLQRGASVICSSLGDSFHLHLFPWPWRMFQEEEYLEAQMQ
ncbi:copper homeostasis protein cutC homolog isoform X4 [Ochotona curzoniae]|uniref:copper homeostasis protein cutC homolog isoform X4 n=1 Tax=Ochotona curzoniae TaxID=130825 RepID=UPI001B3488ED|nr:copper homeostasis protein cutC homolog isoform X4 [Ochotona curzoniae]